MSDIDVQIGSEKYRLVPDEELPGAWKWAEAQMTDFQEQTVLRRLITEPAINPEVHRNITDVERDSSLSVVAHTENGESIVAYHQDFEGICHTNIVTTNLSSEEILDIINQIITSPEIENDHKELKLIADELLTQIESEITLSPQVVAFDKPLSQPYEEEETVAFLDEDELMPEPTIEDYLPDPWEEEVDLTELNIPKTTQSLETEGVAHQDKHSSQESTETETKIQGKPKQKTAASYTYEQISDSDVSPETKRWVREVEVPVSNAVANSREEQARLKEENIKIAQTVVEMLKTYGEETIHGYEAYKSDAFVIKLEGSKYSIHHRRDELYCFGNPLMQFSLDSKGNPKIDIPPTQMLPVERQEFLMVGERQEYGKELPNLAIARIEDIANNLGSLAPSGTFKAIQENHRWAETILPITNNIFQVSRLENKVESPSRGIELIKGNNYQLELNRNDKTLKISSINDNRTVVSYDLAKSAVIAANPTEQDKQSWFLMSQKSQVKQSKRNDIEL